MFRFFSLWQQLQHRFPLCIRRRDLSLISALCLGLAAHSTDLKAGNAVISDTHVHARMILMRAQKDALLTLSDMMAGRRVFVPKTARAARRVLMENTRRIPKSFAKQRMETNSHARPEIWTHWQDFEARASAARQAARQISASSLQGLRRSLPTMVEACHSCHQSYRRVPNRAITH